MNARDGWDEVGTKPLLILQTGSSSPLIRQKYGDYDRMFVRAGALEKLEAQHLLRRVHAQRGERPEKPQVYAGVVVSGSDAMVSDRLPWSEAAAGWLRDALDVGLPVFGVCYGHQLLAHALGGVVEDHPAGLEVGSHDIALHPQGAREAVLAGTPASFTANLFHQQTVAVLPKEATVLAGSVHDPHQILRYAPMAWSTQFHPEFDGEIMRDIMAIEEKRGNPRALRAEAADAPYARSILRRFITQIPGLGLGPEEN
jgi:GMP synthase (glutamine-hydrolysing)